MLARILTTLILPPGGPILLGLLAIALGLRGRRRWAVGLGFLAGATLYAASTPMVAYHLARSLEQHHVPASFEALPEADAIVILGGAVGPELAPRQGPDLTSRADRVLHGARLHRAGKAPLVVPTGAYRSSSPAERSEAAEIEKLLLEWGVPREAILLEPTALTTRENAIRTAAILERQGVKHVLLVTSAMHMPRALATFRATGLEVTPAPTDVLAAGTLEPSVFLWLPRADALEESSRALHEWLGLAWYRLRGWLG